MSSIPLMTLHNSKPASDETYDSDQLSDEEDDPLEGLLARMKYRPQNYRPLDFWSCVLCSGAACFVVGFVVSYVLFLSIDQNSRYMQTIDYDANPQIASAFLQEISAASIGNFVRALNVSRNESQHSSALKLQRHFLSLGFDSVSPVTPTEVILSYYDGSKQNLVTFVDASGDSVRVMSGITYEVNSHVEGFPVSSTVNGTVAYINFGRDSDFAYLETLSVSIKGRILLARLGKESPVDLVHTCLEKGAVGIILFADPEQYPDIEKGAEPFLLPSQLGILQKMHGNPATEGTNITNCLPLQIISAQDAKYILTRMSSSDPFPESWKGSMSISYQTGPEFSSNNWKLKMEMNMVNLKKTYYSVTGAIRGSHEPDRYVLLGSSHGLLSGNYTFGAMASMMEVARVFNMLISKRGWRPRRSVVFCSWGFNSVDGIVTPVLLNSEWGHSMRQRAVAYLGVDISVKAYRSLSVEASPLLFKTVYNASSLVPSVGPAEAKPGVKTVFDTWLKSVDPNKPKLNIIKGEGNAQSVLYDLGVPSLNVHLTTTEAGDEALGHHREVAQLWSVLTWLLADSLVVPLDIKQYATFLHDSVNSILTRYKKEVKARDLSLLNLENVVQNFTSAAELFQNKILHLDKSESLEMRILNDQQLQLERAFLHLKSNRIGLSSRHVLFSPGGSVNLNRTAGFGTLQDLLDNLVSSPVPDFVRTKVEDHLQSLIHCIISAALGLRIPLHLPVL